MEIAQSEGLGVNWLQLVQLPDLSQSTYSALPNGDPNALLAQFEPSLRMLHRLCSSYGLQLRLGIRVDPTQPPGQRLQIALGFAGESQALQAAPLWPTWLATPLAPFFAPMMQQGGADPLGETTPTALGLMGCEVARMERYWPLAELGDEAFVRHSELPGWLHAVYPWEGNESCRLMSVLQLMQTLGEPCALTLALTPSEGEAEYEALHPFYASSLARLQGGSHKDALGRTEFVKPGPVAEQLRSLRQDLLDKLRCEPCFAVQLRCYAPTRDAARLLADTVMAEAVSEGPHACWPLPSDLGFFEPAPDALVSLKPPEGVGLPPALQRLPRVFALSEVAALFRLPVLYEGEQLDLRKETWPSLPGQGQRQVLLGHTLTPGQDGGDPVHLPLDAMVKHTLVVGVPGSGKTNTLMSLARQVWVDHQVPFLVLEPAKREYRGLLNLPGCAGEVLLFAPGRSAPAEWLLEGRFNPLALRFNPFQMPLGYSVAEHRANLLHIFKSTFILFEPMPVMVEAAITQAYADLGWEDDDIATPERVQRHGWPTMRQFVVLVREQAEKTDFIGENAATVKGVLQYGMGRFVEPPLAQVFDCDQSSLEPEQWLQRPAIVELESLGEANANFVSLLLQTYLRETLTVLQEAEREAGVQRLPGQQLRHLLFVEEAHNLIGPSAHAVGDAKSDPKVAATAYVVKMLAEVRALGLGIVIGDQLPSALASEVLKNTSIRICHRLSAPDDRQQMQQSMNASDLQFELMATQTSGQALVNWEGVRKPFGMQLLAADGQAGRHNQAFSDKALLRNIANADQQPDLRWYANAELALLEAKLHHERQSYPHGHGLGMRDIIDGLTESAHWLITSQAQGTPPNDLGLHSLWACWLGTLPQADALPHWYGLRLMPVARALLDELSQRYLTAGNYLRWLRHWRDADLAGRAQTMQAIIRAEQDFSEAIQPLLADLIKAVKAAFDAVLACLADAGPMRSNDPAIARDALQNSLLNLLQLFLQGAVVRGSWPRAQAERWQVLTGFEPSEARAVTALQVFLDALQRIELETNLASLPSVVKAGLLVLLSDVKIQWGKATTIEAGATEEGANEEPRSRTQSPPRTRRQVARLKKQLQLAEQLFNVINQETAA